MAKNNSMILVSPEFKQKVKMLCLVERKDITAVINKLLIIWLGDKDLQKRVQVQEDIVVDPKNKDKLSFRTDIDLYQNIKIEVYKQKLSITKLVSRLLTIWSDPEDPLYAVVNKELDRQSNGQR